MRPSEEQISRWLKQVEDLKEEFEDDPPSCGDSIFVTASDEMVRDYGISRFGRLETDGTDHVYRFADDKIDNPSLFNFGDSVDFSICDKFIAGEWVPDIDWFAKQIPIPVPKKTMALRSVTKSFESRLLPYLGHRFGSFGLLNPSYNTIKMSKGLRVTVYLTDMNFYEDYRRQISSIRESWDIKRAKDIHEICYIGSSQSAYTPPRYVKTILNPYSSWSQQGLRSFFENVDGSISIFFEKDGREVCDRIESNGLNILYSPPDVDNSFGGDCAFWIDSSEDLGIPVVKSEIVPHTPLFIPRLPPYSDQNGYKVSSDHLGIYDVSGPGTYFSRRARYQLKFPDQRWVSYSRTGIPLTRYTTFIHRFLGHHFVENDEGDFHFFHDGDAQVLPSDTTALSLPDRIVPVSSFSSDAIGFRYESTGLHPISGFPEGELRKLRTYYHDSVTHVIHPGGNAWVGFLTTKDFAKYKWSIISGGNKWKAVLARGLGHRYQGKKEQGVFALLRNLFLSYKVLRPYDYVPIDNIRACWDTGPPDSVLSSFIKYIPDVSVFGPNQYIDLTIQDAFVFSGVKKGLPCADGCTPQAVYHYLRSQRGLISITCSDPAFDWFCKGMSVLHCDARKCYGKYNFFFFRDIG